MKNFFKEIGQKSIQAITEIIETKTTDINKYHFKPTLEIEIRESVCPPKNSADGMHIVVVGSIHTDYVIDVAHMPKVGETLLSQNTVILPGGKGGNQAVGVSRLGGTVYLIGKIGCDSEGKKIYNSLLNQGVKLDGVQIDNETHTGKAYIYVDENADSSIVIYSGANSKLSPYDIENNIQLFKNAKYCLLSLEIYKDTVEYALQVCRKNGVQTIIKPSTLTKVSEEMYEYIDYFVANEKEIATIIDDDTISIQQKADIIYKKGARNVIITLGGKGCYLKNNDYERFFKAADNFQAVDTTGAADSFVSALAVSLSEKNSLLYSIEFATLAAGISITRQGVQEAMPTRDAMNIYKDTILSKIV